MAFALSTRDGHRVAVRGDRIADPHTPAQYDADVGAGQIMPGLINAHDHLYLNHYPRLGSPPYPNAYEWGRDIHERFRSEIRRASSLPRTEALLFGALKNLLGGVTTVVHHDAWSDDLGAGFPIRVARVRVAHSLGFERDLAGAVAGDRDTRGRPFSMHLAEGADAIAATEVRSAHRNGLLDRALVAVHLIGVDDADIEVLGTAGAAAVWCPTSNHFLFNRTAPRALFQGGVDVLLGTDSLLTGDGTMLDELREARRAGYLSDERLRAAVGEVAARRLGLPTPGLEPGRPADLMVLRRPLFEARPADVVLVLVNGLPRLADADLAGLFDHCRVATEHLDVGGTRKVVAAPLATVAAKVFELTPECRRIVES